MIRKAVDLSVIEFRRMDRLSGRPSSRGVPAQTAIGRQFPMLTHPTRKGGWRDFVALGGFQFGRSFGKGIAEVIKRDAVENDAKRISFVPQLRGRWSEHAPAKSALPELDYLKLLTARAFAYEAGATAMRAADGRFDGVRDAMGVCKRSSHTEGDGFTLPCHRHITTFGSFSGVPALG
jgi:hypothetical protein